MFKVGDIIKRDETGFSEVQPFTLYKVREVKTYTFATFEKTYGLILQEHETKVDLTNEYDSSKFTLWQGVVENSLSERVKRELGLE